MKHKRRKRKGSISDRYMCALEIYYPKDIPKYAVGACSYVAEVIAKQMVKHGMTMYKVAYGLVVFSDGQSHKHTWMVCGDTYYDPTLEQFKSYGCDISTVQYMTHKSMGPANFMRYVSNPPLPDRYIEHLRNNELRTPYFTRYADHEVYDLKSKPLKVAV